MKHSNRHLSLRTAAFTAAGVLTTSALIAAGSLVVIPNLLRKREDETLEQAVDRYSSIARTVGKASGSLVTLGSLAALLALRQLVHLPLLRLNSTISEFASGKKQARANQEEIKEIDNVANVFNNLAQESSEREQRQLQFLAGIAHDVRNPLTTIEAAIGFLKNESLPPDQLREKLSIIDRQVIRLGRLVSDFLDASKIQAGKLDLKPKTCDLGELACASASLWEHVSPKHQIEVKVPYKPIEAVCDADRIQQVLNNLISNAIHYSPNGGPVDIDVEKRNSSVVISVRDRGIGIRKEDVSDIFKPFHRSAQARELIEGVGLGLSVSKDIIEAHGGKVEVESKPGEGSIFRVVIPREVRQLKAA